MRESPPQTAGTSLPPKAAAAPQFAIEQERRASPSRLAELDHLRTGSADEVRSALEQHLHSDRFFIDDDRIWLELPNRNDGPPDTTSHTPTSCDRCETSSLLSA